MNIRLFSTEFRIHGGACVFSNGNPLWQSGADLMRSGHCSENLLMDAEIGQPGTYFLWLVGATVEHVASRTRTAFDMVSPWRLTLLEEDLRIGEVTLPLESEQLFMVTVTRSGLPVRGEPVLFLSEMEEGEITCEIHTNAQGTIAVLGRSLQAKPLEGKDLVLTIERLR